MAILKADYSKISHEDMAALIGLKSKHVPIILTSFLDETKSLLNALEESVTLKDCEKIRLNAHAIKGSAGNLRFIEIENMAKEMEQAGIEKNCDFNYKEYIWAIDGSIKTILV